MRLLSVDPAVVNVGLAKFVDNTLIGAIVQHGDGFKDDLNRVHTLAFDCAEWGVAEGDHGLDDVAMEWPQIYGGRRAGGRKDPNDMLPLAAFNGALASEISWRHAGSTPVFHVYRPHSWKGSKSKNPMARVIIDRLEWDERKLLPDEVFIALSAAEAKGVECKHPFMNAIDAIGIGLHHLGRLKIGGPVRRRVVHRE